MDDQGKNEKSKPSIVFPEIQQEPSIGTEPVSTESRNTESTKREALSFEPLNFGADDAGSSASHSIASEPSSWDSSKGSAFSPNQETKLLPESSNTRSSALPKMGELEEDFSSFGTGTAQELPKRSSKKLITIIAASVAGVILLAGAGFGVWRYQRVQALESDCRGQVAALNKRQQTLQQLVNSKKVVQALSITNAQVADAKVITNLKKVVDNAKQKVSVPECSVGFFELGKQPIRVSDSLAEREQAIQRAVNAVNASVTAKKVADAKAALQTIIDNANKVLADSEGQVADNTTRDQLQQAIDTANQLIADKTLTDVSKLSPDALNQAVDAVNNSVSEKQQADALAAQTIPQYRYRYPVPDTTGAGNSNLGTNGQPSTNDQNQEQLSDQENLGNGQTPQAENPEDGSTGDPDVTASIEGE